MLMSPSSAVLLRSLAHSSVENAVPAAFPGQTQQPAANRVCYTEA
jgi:hypothetical protein